MTCTPHSSMFFVLVESSHLTSLTLALRLGARAGSQEHGGLRTAHGGGARASPAEEGRPLLRFQPDACRPVARHCHVAQLRTLCWVNGSASLHRRGQLLQDLMAHTTPDRACSHNTRRAHTSTQRDETKKRNENKQKTTQITVSAAWKLSESRDSIRTLQWHDRQCRNT